MEKKLQEMIRMQRALDKAIYDGHDVDYDYKKTKLALIDELGELTHELKGNWCWWKKTQKPVDRTKVLEELVDCWHFAMSIAYHDCDSWGFKTYLICETVARRKAETYDLYKLITDVISSDFDLEPIFALTYTLGFTFDDVYWMYLTKNAENFSRLERGY